jgi:hypothetical protein
MRDSPASAAKTRDAKIAISGAKMIGGWIYEGRAATVEQ